MILHLFIFIDMKYKFELRLLDISQGKYWIEKVYEDMTRDIIATLIHTPQENAQTIVVGLNLILGVDGTK